MKFPAKLSRLCWQRGWTQRELAEQLGDVSKSTVSNWMTGKSDPRLAELGRLARLFQVSVDYLVLEEREEPGGDGLGEAQRRLLWAAETVGLEVALRRIMNAPPQASDAAAPWSGVGSSGASEPRETPIETAKQARPDARGGRARRTGDGKGR